MSSFEDAVGPPARTRMVASLCAIRAQSPARVRTTLGDRKAGAAQHELADALTVSRPTATRLLDGLEKKGLIRRWRRRRSEAVLDSSHGSGGQIGPALNAASAAVTKRLKHELGPENFGNYRHRLRFPGARVRGRQDPRRAEAFWRQDAGVSLHQGRGKLISNIHAREGGTDWHILERRGGSLRGAPLR
jgi:hypothetical protein